ncbi:MAG: aminomethyl-transferring glycine dehydrogenase subunit GcvPB [Muribaculaceae bacterium]|nr:aminomethyl-transferring glycine dehydrogenase subunit GcvPB [Muribaculaceae bacterium]
MNKEIYGNLIFELSNQNRKGYKLPKNDFPDEDVIPEKLRREKEPQLPQVDEPTVVRHYTNMSTNNFGVDTGFYPLGSCTMKYNPKINEQIASDDSILSAHPYQPDSTVQGNLELYFNLQRFLSEIGGMAEFTLNPYAGAHGELTGLMIIKAYHESNGDTKRNKVVVPDSAHGTNPASAAVAGFDVVEVKSLPDGTIDVESLKAVLDDSVAAVMMTNPNTLGIFEKNIPQISEIVHESGALLYYDGANLNPLLGVARPGDMGFDVMHINLHKTFSTPHGGGGPGSGPVGVRKGLEKFLPYPKVVRKTDGSFSIMTDDKESMGSISPTLGNFDVQVKALTYILSLGKEGLKEAGSLATLNANYIKEKLKEYYLLPIEGVCKHEFVFDGLKDKSTGVTTLNIAKRLLDMGYHAPTIYFPLLFHESLMIEPTETESKETIDQFIEAMKKIAKEATENPEIVKSAPHHTPVTRPDDTEAALHPVVTWNDLKQQNNNV